MGDGTAYNALSAAITLPIGVVGLITLENNSHVLLANILFGTANIIQTMLFNRIKPINHSKSLVPLQILNDLLLTFGMKNLLDASEMPPIITQSMAAINLVFAAARIGITKRYPQLEDIDADADANLNAFYKKVLKFFRNSDVMAADVLLCQSVLIGSAIFNAH